MNNDLVKTMSLAHAIDYMQTVIDKTVRKNIGTKIFHNAHRRMFFINSYGMDAERLRRAFPDDAIVINNPDVKREKVAKITIQY